MYVRIPGISLIVPTVYTVSGRGGDDRPPRLDAHPRRHPERVAGVAHDVAPLRDRRRLLGGDVGNAEPAAEHELGQAERRREPRHHLGRLGEARRREHVRADVAVQPDEAHAARPQRPLDRPLGVAVGEVEPELRVVLTGGDELVRVGVHAGRDPQQHVGRIAGAVGDERVEPVHLVERVDDDVADAARRSRVAARRRSCCCRASRTPTPARRRRARRATRPRWRRRAASPRRTRGAPSLGTGTPSWRRSRWPGPNAATASRHRARTCCSS